MIADGHQCNPTSRKQHMEGNRGQRYIITIAAEYDNVNMSTYIHTYTQAEITDTRILVYSICNQNVLYFCTDKKPQYTYNVQ